MHPLFRIGDRVKYTSMFNGVETGKIVQVISAPEPYGIIYDVKLDQPRRGSLNGGYEQFPESLLEEA